MENPEIVKATYYLTGTKDKATVNTGADFIGLEAALQGADAWALQGVKGIRINLALPK